jgi:hypothetical protein
MKSRRGIWICALSLTNRLIAGPLPAAVVIRVGEMVKYGHGRSCPLLTVRSERIVRLHGSPRLRRQTGDHPNALRRAPMRSFSVLLAGVFASIFVTVGTPAFADIMFLFPGDSPGGPHYARPSSNGALAPSDVCAISFHESSLSLWTERSPKSSRRCISASLNEPPTGMPRCIVPQRYFGCNSQWPGELGSLSDRLNRSPEPLYYRLGAADAFGKTLDDAPR